LRGSANDLSGRDARAPTLDLITATGAQIRFLPACSPDLNPIEKMWSKIKNFLRQVEARTEAARIEAIGAALALVTPPRRKKLVCRLWLQYY
jgi:transposase